MKVSELRAATEGMDDKAEVFLSLHGDVPCLSEADLLEAMPINGGRDLQLLIYVDDEMDEADEELMSMDLDAEGGFVVERIDDYEIDPVLDARLAKLAANSPTTRFPG